MVNLTINGKEVTAEAGATILETAKANDILIPTLCYLEGVHQAGACRVCVVEVEGARNLQASCMVPVRDGMVVQTNTKTVRKARQMLYELILSDHPADCLACLRNQNCELQRLGQRLGVSQSRFEGPAKHSILDISPSIYRDTSKCVLCRRCVTVCNQVQQVGILNAQNRGYQTVIGPAMNLSLSQVDCSYCGQCTTVCPVGALGETDAVSTVWRALDDPSKRTVVQVAPAIRAALGEEFGLPPGTLVTGKLASALRQIGFDDVFDTNFAADLTIMEEGTEFLGRVKAALTGGEQAVLPMITSCSPGWVKHIEHAFPSQIGHLSTCKSPHTMLGAVAKSFYAERIEADPKDMFVVSVMPCTAKKFEISRPEMANGGLPNVDAVLTTRELARMIKEAGIDFVGLEDSDFDAPLGLSSGAADIFGVTGGVMEAALRTVYEIVTGRELPFDQLHVKPIMGLEPIKEAAFTIEDPLDEYAFLDGIEVKVAVTSGLANADILMEQIAKGESPYLFIEVMGCPGGCISGGGQPRPTTPAIREKRLQAIYRADEAKTLRKSHENPYIQRLYDDYLGQPCGHLAHDLLHTHYTARGRFNELIADEPDPGCELFEPALGAQH
ncbi:MAG: [FeFe] hydrogenase, group A [Bifidobacteriaceae bacterium]|nr:[FeFe] hydrogenase, group A [Bifidobacteriaceae bacterium]